MGDHSDLQQSLVSIFRWGYSGAPAKNGTLKQAGRGQEVKKTFAGFTEQEKGPSNVSRTSPVTVVPPPPKTAVAEREAIPRTQVSHHAPVDGLDHWVQAVKGCQACSLKDSRNLPVCGTGSNRPEVLILGAMPGYEEDQVGVPFVSGSGQYLDKWLEAIGLDRYKTAYLSYLLHCHGPVKEGMAANVSSCRPHLEALIGLLRPKVMLMVGKTSADWLMGEDTGVPDTTLRTYSGIPVLVTHEPGEVLRDPSLKRQVWDVLRLMKTRFLA